MNALEKICSGFLLFVDLSALVFFGGVALFGIAEGNEFIILAAMLTASLLITAVTVTAMVRAAKGKEGPLFRNSVLMKLSIFFTAASFSFLAFEEPLAPFLIFLSAGLLLAAVTVFIIKRTPRVRPAAGPHTAPPYSFTYKGKWEWEAAAAEYMRLHGISDAKALTDEENNQIYDYTATPFSYFFFWLAVSGFLSQSFNEDFPEEDFIGKMKTRKLTPVEVLAQGDYYFGSEYLLEGILPFFRTYYDTQDRFTGRNSYLFDYYDAIGNPDNRYYCVDFSWEILDRLMKVIETRYQNWNRDFSAYSSSDYYDDSEVIAPNVHSALFDADLEVHRSGVRRNGIPDADVDSYLAKCIACLDSLPKKEIERLERWFDGQYGVEETPEITSIKEFSPLSLYLADPETPGDIVFVVSGEASFEPEHGISFTVRNGFVIDWGYSYDFEDPYSEMNREKYDVISSMDFTAVRTKADAERYLASGQLVRVKLLPGIPGCRTKSEEDCIYLTPRALAQKEAFEKRLRNIRACSYLTAPNVLYAPYYEENRDRSPVSVVPHDLYIRNEDSKSLPFISFSVHVWY